MFLKVTEGSSGTKEAIDKLGLDSGQILADLKGGGDKAGEAFMLLMEKLSGVTNDTELTAIAVEIFGTKAEDLGAKVVRGIGQGADEFGRMHTEASKINDIKYDDFQSRIASLKRSFEVDIVQPIAEAVLPIFEKMLPAIQNIISDVSNWIEENQFLAVAIAGLVAGIGVFLSVIAPIITMVSLATIAFGSLSVVVISLPTIIAILVTALVGIVTAIGQNEDALNAIIEKWGFWGAIVAGVCESVSGIVTWLVNTTIQQFKFMMAVIGAIFSKDKTISQAWQDHQTKLAEINQKGMDDIFAKTSVGLSKLGIMSDAELQKIQGVYKTSFDALPLIAEGSYEEASGKIAQGLAHLNNDQLLGLQAMNSTTKTLFKDINAGMSVDQAKGQLLANFNEMNANGTLNVQELEKAISNGMFKINQKMDVKENAVAMGTDLQNANVQGSKAVGDLAKNVEGDTGDIQKSLSTNTKVGANEAVKAMQDAQKGIATASGGAKTSATGDFEEINKSVSGNSGDANTNAVTSFQNLANLIRPISATLRTHLNNDWNSIRTNYAKGISGTITVTRNEVQGVAQAQTFSQSWGLVNESMNEMANRASRANVSSFSGITSDSLSRPKSNSDNKLVGEVRELKNLVGLLLEKETSINIDNALAIDGRQIAKSTAQYMETELNTLNKRKNRLGGNF